MKYVLTIESENSEELVALLRGSPAAPSEIDNASPNRAGPPGGKEEDTLKSRAPKARGTKAKEQDEKRATREEMVTALQKVTKTSGLERAEEIVARVLDAQPGTRRVSDVPEAKYAETVRLCEESLATSASSSAPTSPAPDLFS